MSRKTYQTFDVVNEIHHSLFLRSPFALSSPTFSDPLFSLSLSLLAIDVFFAEWI